MNYFFAGMGKFDMFPKRTERKPNSAWYSVGEAFRATGRNMWQAINEFPKPDAHAEHKTFRSSSPNNTARSAV
jgi:hypothetical protein